MTMDVGDIALIRTTFEAALSAMTTDAAALLADLGWWDLHDAEPGLATGELFEAQGRVGRATSALDIVVAEACGETPAPRTGVVHPGPGAWGRPPGCLEADGTVRFDGLVLAGIERADRLFVPFHDGETLGVVSVDLAAVERLVPVAGFDPSQQLVSVTGAVAISGGAGRPVPVSWTEVAGAARRAVAHELCGMAQAMLDDAAAYVTDRHQFGRPIAVFQTVRHRLTEVFVALASARAALDAAWTADDPLLGDAAKVLAGRAGQLAARHCLQVTGAVGFTAEYPLAARMRRLMLLDGLYGSADEIQTAIGTRLLTERRLPRLHPLP